MSDQDQANRLGFFILKKVKRALRDFAMIRPGDRIAVAVSGGKDSLSLLRLLQLLQVSTRAGFEVQAIHVSGDARGALPVHQPLADWLAGQSAGYRIVHPGYLAGEALPMDCQRCSWLRRKALFETAAAMGCNVVAYAHHADDAAQTTLLNLVYGGQARTLAPQATYFGGRFRLVRPLIYVPESELRRFAQALAAPAPPPLCPRADGSRRMVAAGMLRLLGSDYLRQGRMNLIRAGLDNSSVRVDPDAGDESPNKLVTFGA